MEKVRRLITLLERIEDIELLANLLSRLTHKKNGLSYIEFLGFLILVSEHQNRSLHVRLAESLNLAMHNSNFPTGELSAWGAGSAWHEFSGPGFSAHQLAMIPKRRYGILEFLTVWYGQKTQKTYLSGSLYRFALIRLLYLFDASPTLRERYCQHLLLVVETGFDGAYSKASRARLRVLANSWQQRLAPDEIVQTIMKI